MDQKDRVVELLELEIAIYTVLKDLLLKGAIDISGVMAGTDGSRPDHYVFRTVK